MLNKAEKVPATAIRKTGAFLVMKLDNRMSRVEKGQRKAW